MSKLPAEHEVTVLAEKILVQLAGKPLVAVRSVHLLSVQADHVEHEVVVKTAFALAETFLKERSRRATARTDAILKEIERVTKRRGSQKMMRKKGKR